MPICGNITLLTAKSKFFTGFRVLVNDIQLALPELFHFTVDREAMT